MKILFGTNLTWKNSGKKTHGGKGKGKKKTPFIGLKKGLTGVENPFRPFTGEM